MKEILSRKRLIEMSFLKMSVRVEKMKNYTNSNKELLKMMEIEDGDLRLNSRVTKWIIKSNLTWCRHIRGKV